MDGKTALTVATKAFLSKHLLTPDAFSLLKNMDNACETSLQELLTSVTKSLEGAEGALRKPEPANVVAYKEDRGWKEATNETSTSQHYSVVLKVNDDGSEALLDETLTKEVEEVCRVAARGTA